MKTTKLINNILTIIVVIGLMTCLLIILIPEKQYVCKSDNTKLELGFKLHQLQHLNYQVEKTYNNTETLNNEFIKYDKLVNELISNYTKGKVLIENNKLYLNITMEQKEVLNISKFDININTRSKNLILEMLESNNYICNVNKKS